MLSPLQQRGPERLRMPNAMPVLSEKMNPRSSASAYPRMRGGSRAGKEYAYDVNPYSWDTMDGQPEPDDILHDPRGDEP